MIDIQYKISKSYDLNKFESKTLKNNILKNKLFLSLKI